MITFKKWKEVYKLRHFRNNLEKYMSFREEEVWTRSEENLSSLPS